MVDKTVRNDFLSMIFKTDYRWLVSRLRSRIGDKHYAEDVASETFTQLAGLKELLNVREPRAMLTTISRRIMHELSRRRDLEKAYLEALALRPELTTPSPEEHHLLMEALLKIDEALSGLSAKARAAFFYSQLDGLTYSQIAEKLGVSQSMVRQYMASALTRCYLASQQETI